MEILVVTNGIPTPKYPLLGIFEFDQAKALAAMGHNVFLAGIDLRSFRRKRKWGIFLGEKEGVKWFVIAIPIGAVPLQMKCLIGKKVLNVLYKKIFANKDKPDIIHAHFTDMGFIASDLAKKQNIPLVITEHSSLINRDKIEPSLFKIAYCGYNSATQIVSVSNALKEKIYLNFGIESKVIPNIVALEEFFYAPQKHEGFRFVITANLVPIKCHRLLIQAFTSVYATHQDVFLDIVGDGRLRNELEELVDAMNLKNRVCFHGLLPRKRIAELYRSCDCFVLPSSSETFGVAYIEAMVSGLPVIATKCGGPEDFISEETGILVSTGNLEELEKSMVYIYDHYEKYDRKAISCYAANRFSANKIAEEITSVYEEIKRT